MKHLHLMARGEPMRMRLRLALGLLLMVVAATFAANSAPTSMTVVAASPPQPAPTGILSFKGGETGTKTVTLPVSQAQCSAFLASKKMHADNTKCIETVTAGSVGPVPAAPGPMVLAASSWHYVYHYTETCWTFPGFPQCYFLALKDEATFQFNYANVYVAAGTGVACSRPQQVFPDSASIWWCGGWNNGGAPVYGNGYQHWMNVGDNATVCLGVGSQACKDHWQRLNIDAWGNWWLTGGWF
jgi:hypothetical protein